MFSKYMCKSLCSFRSDEALHCELRKNYTVLIHVLAILNPIAKLPKSTLMHIKLTFMQPFDKYFRQTGLD